MTPYQFIIWTPYLFIKPPYPLNICMTDHTHVCLCATSLGSSDPYVQLTVLPQWKFTESNKKGPYKTQVEKETLDPYFNKEFHM